MSKKLSGHRTEDVPGMKCVQEVQIPPAGKFKKVNPVYAN